MQKDILLYQGILLVSKEENTLQMQHLNAIRDYERMGFSPIKDINENQRLYIIAANESPSKKLSISDSVVSIEKDNSILTDEIAFGLGETFDISSLVKKLESNKNTVQVFSGGVNLLSNPLESLTTNSSYDSICFYLFYDSIQTAINRNLNFLNKNLSVPYYPLKLKKDKSSKYVSRIISHDPVYNAPANISYSVTEEIGEGDKKEIKELKTSSYRINKLYRVRFRAGFIYSLLEDIDYSSNAGILLSDTTKYGLDGTFGIQINFWKKDIKKNNQRWHPVGYVGFSHA